MHKDSQRLSLLFILLNIQSIFQWQLIQPLRWQPAVMEEGSLHQRHHKSYSTWKIGPGTNNKLHVHILYVALVAPQSVLSINFRSSLLELVARHHENAHMTQ